MSYPPQGHPPQNAYPPPHGHPAQYGYPQQYPQGYPQQQYPPQQYPQQQYPPQQYPQQQYPPPQYPPPPPAGYQQNPQYPPQQMPRRKPKWSALRIVLTVVLLGGATWYGVMAFNADRPALGDCLASMESDFFGGMEVVECSDSNAAFEVVEYTATGSASDARASICDGHPEGQSYVKTGKRSRLSWAICAVPVSASDGQKQ